MTRGGAGKKIQRFQRSRGAGTATPLTASAACGEEIDASEQRLWWPFLSAEQEATSAVRKAGAPQTFLLLDSEAREFCMNR